MTPNKPASSIGQVDLQTTRRMLTECRTVAVVGLSDQGHRPSASVARYLQTHGYRVIPVNPRHGQLLGRPCYARLEDIPEPVDLVVVFRRAEELPPLAQSAVAIGARCLWQQLGIASAGADEVARAAGLISVADRCIKIEHARLFSGGPGIALADPSALGA
jgi:predicted CoA-binding protein